MINIKFFKKNGIVLGFEISGHSGYAKSGQDIVCAAVSAVSQSTCLGVTDVLKINAKLKRDDNIGYLYLRLPKDVEQTKMQNAQTLLVTMQQSLENIAFQFNDYIKMEVKDEIN